MPTSHLVDAIEELFDLRKLVPAWLEMPKPKDACYGPRVRGAPGGGRHGGRSSGGGRRQRCNILEVRAGSADRGDRW